MAFLLTILILYLVFVISSLITSLPAMLKFKKVYKTLPLMNFLQSSDLIYGNIAGERDSGFLWFTNDNTIRLDRDNYIHSGPFLWFNPYSLYWQFKFVNWLKKNALVLSQHPRANVNTYEYINPDYIAECFIDRDIKVYDDIFGFKSIDILLSSAKCDAKTIELLREYNIYEGKLIAYMQDAIEKVKIEYPNFKYNIKMPSLDIINDGVYKAQIHRILN